MVALANVTGAGYPLRRRDLTPNQWMDLAEVRNVLETRKLMDAVYAGVVRALAPIFGGGD